jgi:DNA repair protein RadA/Sms
MTEKPSPADCVFAAEVGLGGELRGVTMAEARIKEAEKLGFAQIVLAPSSASAVSKSSKIKVRSLSTIAEVLNAFW